MARRRVTSNGPRRRVGLRSGRRAGRTQWRVRMPALPRPGLRERRAFALAIVVGAVVAGAGWLYQSPFLSIRGVTVEGNVVLSEEAIKDVAALGHESVIRPDFGSAEERLLAIPVVKDVSISHNWPAGAHITIEERTPWGLWLAGSTLYVIDDEGVVLDLPPPDDAPVVVQTDTAGQPLVPGAQVDRGAIAVAYELVASSEQTLGRSVTGLEFSQARGLTAVLENDLRVAFGDDQGLDFKVAALFAVLEDAAAEGRSLKSVDLRFADRVAVQ